MGLRVLPVEQMSQNFLGQTSWVVIVVVVALLRYSQTAFLVFDTALVFLRENLPVERLLHPFDSSRAGVETVRAEAEAVHRPIALGTAEAWSQAHP